MLDPAQLTGVVRFIKVRKRSYNLRQRDYEPPKLLHRGRVLKLRYFELRAISRDPHKLGLRTNDRCQRGLALESAS